MLLKHGVLLVFDFVQSFGEIQILLSLFSITSSLEDKIYLFYKPGVKIASETELKKRQF